MTTHCYINRQSSQLQIWVILRVLEVMLITCNMGTFNLPDMYDLKLWTYIHIRQIPHAHTTTITHARAW